jgi:macrolide transport system ATP-binding/permease protein
MHEFQQDVRFAVRTFAKSPVVTAVIVLSLALGVGANTAMFTVVNSLLLKSLPVENPEQLVLFSEGRNRGFVSGQGGTWGIFSYPLYRHLKQNQRVLEDVAAFRTQLDRVSLRPTGAASDSTPQVAWGRLVSGNYFDVLRVKPAAGRLFTPDDDRAGAVPTAVLSFGFWQRRFNSDRSIIGQSFELNGLLVQIAGVAAAEFFGESVEAEIAEVWLPLTLQPLVMPRPSVLEEADTSWLNLLGRLKPGSTLEQAQAEANVLFQQFQLAHLSTDVSQERREELERSRIVMSPGGSGISNLRFRYSRPLHILLALVGFVLLITCANIANMMLSRAAAREKEISMRVALGANRGRLFRQLLTESLVIASTGAVVGVLLSFGLVRLLVAGVSSDDRSVPLDLTPDLKFFGFVLTVTVLSAVLFGIAPAMRALRVDVWPVLKGLNSGSPRMRWGLARALVVAQIALSAPLLVGAGLFVQTLRGLQSQDFGYAHEQVLEVAIAPEIGGHKPEQLDPLYRALLDGVNAVPGVRVASLSLYSPMSGNNWSGPIEVTGYKSSTGRGAGAQWVWVGPRYVETAGLRLVGGRDLSDQDSATSTYVAVVNEEFARLYFPETGPLGRQVTMFEKTVEVVGVVKDFKFNHPRQNNWPVMFLPLSQAPMLPAKYASFLEVRASGDPASLASAVREAIRQVDRNLPVTSIRPLTRHVEDALRSERLIAGLSTFFAGLALLLACIGVYGLLAHLVARRTRDIGVRMAIGADAGRIVRMVLREAGILALIGAAIGLAASFALTRLIVSQLHGLKPHDPWTLAGAAALLLIAAGVAAFIPARRASLVDPITVLRTE